MIAKIVTPESLIKLFGNQSVPTEVGDLSLKFGSLSAWLEPGWKAWLNSHYGFGRVSVGLPPEVAARDQFRLRMEIIQWRWKLTELELPEELQNALAQELAKKYP